MGNITLSMPDELLKKMKQLRDVRWSEIARQAIEERIKNMEEIERIAQKSTLSKKDVDELAKRINASATKRFLNEDSR